MEQPADLEQPAGQPSASEVGSSPAEGNGGGGAASDAHRTPAAAASSAGASASPEAGAADDSRPQRDPGLIAGAELYERHLRRALALPPERRDADVCSFLAAHAELEAAADALHEAEEAASGSGSRPRPGSGAPGSEERQLLGAARYLVGTWATATASGLRHPRLAYAHGPPLCMKSLLWSVSQPVVSFNAIPWEPPPPVALPNDDALRWSEPGAPRLDARRLLLLLLLADAMAAGLGAAGALRFLAATQRTLRSPRAAQRAAAGLRAMAARAGGGAVAPSVHALSVAWWVRTRAGSSSLLLSWA